MLTVPEYNAMMEALELRLLDKKYYLHLQAFLNFSVRAEKKVGKGKSKPVFSKFSKFFDYEKELMALTSRKKAPGKFSGIGKLIKKGEK